MGPLSTLKDRFEKHYEHTPDVNGCLLWLGNLSNNGYGLIWDSLHKRRLLAHRVAYELSEGREPRKLVLHRCGVKRCVNPEHLYEGTYHDNTMDWVNSVSWRARGLDKTKRKPWPRKPHSPETRERMRVSGRKAWIRRKAV